MKYLCITVRWLDDRYHGQNADGEPEWPPSPLRLFQAMLAGAGRRCDKVDYMAGGLQWLENHEVSPIIIAPAIFAGQSYTRFVPNNDSNKLLDRQKRLTAKTVKPIILHNSSHIYYIWPLSNQLTDDDKSHISSLIQASRNITSLGWGVDMAVGNGTLIYKDDVEKLPGERWLPSSKFSGDGLRIPIKGTLDDLVARHAGFLRRMEGNMLTPPPPLSVYEKVEYRRATDPSKRHSVAFSLLKPDASGFRPFDTVRQALTVAGMTRHAAACAAERTHQPRQRINEFILGHGEPRDSGKHVSVGNKRFAYLPLPSIESRGAGQSPVAGNVRRIMLTAFEDGCEEEIAWARRNLSGQSLEPEHGRQDKSAERGNKPVALLSLSPASDPVVRSYVRSSATWATVTPVVLPGYDDPQHYRQRLKTEIGSEEQKRLLNHLDKRIDKLIRKAILQAGFSSVLANFAEIEYRKAGFWRGTEMADSYDVPDHLMRFPLYHVKIVWRDDYQRPMQINGPICIGGGRFYGLGLFAAS